MRNILPQKAERFRRERSKRKRWQRVVKILSCVVVFCTTYALILPAITMEQKTYCGMEEHQHGADCYEDQLICKIPKGHVHTDDCYEESVLTCNIEENHVHTDDCYDHVLVCEKPEHTHEHACYVDPEADDPEEDTKTGESAALSTDSQEFTWQSEDGNVSLEVSFDGLQETGKLETSQTASLLSSEEPEEGEPQAEADQPEESEPQAEASQPEEELVVVPELNREEDVENLLPDEDKTDAWQLMTLRLHLMQGDKEIDLSNCTANVNLTVNRKLISNTESTSSVSAKNGEEGSETLSVVDEDGNELTSEAVGSGEVMLRFAMRADEPAAVNAVSNPGFTIQHYLRYQKVRLASEADADNNAPADGMKLEFIDTSVNGVFRDVGTKGSRNNVSLQNSPTNVNPENNTTPNDKFNIYLNKQDNGKYRFDVHEVVEELFEDEETTYRRDPQMPYMNRLYNNHDSEEDYNEYYTLTEVWVYQPPANGTAKATDDLKESDFIKYTVPLLAGNSSRHDPEKIRFTNNPSNTHISQLDANGTPISTDATEAYPYSYTILIQQGTVVRLVFDGTEDQNYTTENVQFYDYDITDGFIYSDEGLTNQHKTSEQTDGIWYASTNQKGINSIENYPEGTGTNRFAFGNNNTGTGLGLATFSDSISSGNTFNKSNSPQTASGATFGLVTDLTWGPNGYPMPNFTSGIVAPTYLFGAAGATGKTAYVDDYKLNFHRMGGTYILNSVIQKGKDGSADQTVLSGVRDFQYLGDNWNHTRQIISNEFWPLDNCASHGTDGHDLKFGNQNLKGNRKYVGSTSEDLPLTDISSLKGMDVDHNAYIGMSYTVDFSVVPGYSARMNYWFYGDDDMWVFLEEIDKDGNHKEGTQSKLIADVGGVHSSIGEYVNLWEYVKENPIFEKNADGSIKTDADGNPIDNTNVDHYRLTVFYLERGASGSTCYMRFNLPAMTDITPPPTRDKELVFEKKLLGTDGKEVADNSESNKEFNFLLSLTTANEANYEDVYDYAIYNRKTTPDHTASGAQPVRSGTIGTALLESGKYEFTLKGGEYIVISNLPDDIYYTIEETDSDDYVTYFQRGNHTHGSAGPPVDNLGGLEEYSPGNPERYNGVEYNYIRFTNAPPYKTEPDPGPGEEVEIDQVITYEINWAKSRDTIGADDDGMVNVTIRDPLDSQVDFVSAKFGKSDSGYSWWDNSSAYTQSGFPEGVTANITYDSANHQVIWNLSYPKSLENEIPGVVALKVRVSERVDFSVYNPEVANHAFVQVGDNPKIETNWILNPLKQSTTVALQVRKVDPTNPDVPKPLKGASFVLYRTEEDTNYYYSGVSDTSHVATWTALCEDQDETTYAWSSDTDGILAIGSQKEFSHLRDGTYYLKELKAPDGYEKLERVIELQVENGVVTVPEQSDWLSTSTEGTGTTIQYTLTVPNSSGFELPDTGGSGITLYIAGGLALLISAGFVLMYNIKKTKRGDEASS